MITGTDRGAAVFSIRSHRVKSTLLPGSQTGLGETGQGTHFFLCGCMSPGWRPCQDTRWLLQTLPALVTQLWGKSSLRQSVLSLPGMCAVWQPREAVRGFPGSSWPGWAGAIALESGLLNTSSLFWKRPCSHLFIFPEIIHPVSTDRLHLRLPVLSLPGGK